MGRSKNRATGYFTGLLPALIATAGLSALAEGTDSPSPAARPLVHLRFENASETTGVPPQALQPSGTPSLGGPVGGFLVLGENPLIQLSPQVPASTAENNAITIEFLFRPGRDFAKRARERIVSVGPVFAAFTAETIEFGTPGDLFSIPLDGVGPKSLSHYLDDKFHHLVFQLNATTGLKEIHVDGALPEGFSRSVSPDAQIFTTPAGISLGSDLFHERFHGAIDELAIYSRTLTPALIHLHQKARMAGKPYPMIEDPEVGAAPSPGTSGDFDPKEFAPGTAPAGIPGLVVSALEQLKRFPSPRYRASHGLPRNPVYFSWEDLGNGSGASGAPIALELADRWNDALTFKVDASTPAGFADLKQITRSRPDLPVWVFTGRSGQNRARQRQDLPNACYLRSPPGAKPAKHLRPFSSAAAALTAGCSDTTFDSDVSGVIKNLAAMLAEISPTSVIAGISDPGEPFHPTPETLLQMDPGAAQDYAGSGAGDWFTFETRHHARLDARFRDLLKASSARLAGSQFQTHSFEADSAEELEWPHYRQVFTPWKGHTLPTPDFAPRFPGHWRNGSGSWHGISWLVRARREEIERGDLLYSPRSVAGPDANEAGNLRPAQNLGLQKILYALGAPYTFPWLPESPHRPKAEALIHQAAMPSYAQAVFSHVEELLTSGRLLDGDVPLQPTDPESARPGYLFWGGDPRLVIVVRKDPALPRYLIVGTFQPLSSEVGNAETSKTAQIVLEGLPLRFELRRQGSVYLYDFQDPSHPLFYALDSWHEPTHPFEWSPHPEIEAELAEGGFPAEGLSLKTESAAGAVAGNFVGSRTWVAFPAQATGTGLRFHWRPSDTTSRVLSILARSPTPDGTGRISVSVDRGNAIKTPVISSDQWTWIPVPMATLQTPSEHSIQLTVSGGAVEVDKIKLAPLAAPSPEGTREAR